MFRTDFSVQFDIICDYLPIISTITNFYDIWLKATSVPKDQSSIPIGNHFFTHLNAKSYKKCILFAIPFAAPILYFTNKFIKNSSTQNISSSNLPNSITSIISPPEKAKLSSEKAALVERVKLAAQQNGKQISEYIQNQGIEDQTTLIEIATLAARQDGLATSEFIHKYGIKNENALIEIAKIALQQSEGRAAAFIQNYGINDQNALIDIAEFVARENGWGVSCFIQRYGIQDQKALIDIAKLAAQQSGLATSYYIQKYGIQDKNALIDIAKLAAQQNGSATSEYIKNYGIDDQIALADIASLASKQNGTQICLYIKKYQIENQQTRFEIFLESFKNNPESIKHIKNFDLSSEQWPIYDLILQREKGTNILPELQKIFEENWPGHFSAIFEILAKTTDERVISWLIFTSGLLTLHKVLPNPDIWYALFRYPDPKMRYTLSACAVDIFRNQEKIKVYQQICQNTKHLIVPALFFCMQKDPAHFIPLLQIIKKQKNIFKDGKMLRTLIDTLHLLLVHSPEPTTLSVVEHAIKNQERDKIVQNLFSIQGIKACQGNIEEVGTKGIDQVYLETFKKIIPIPDRQDFSQTLQRTFGEHRASLLTYAGKLKTLPDSSRLLAMLGEFTSSVLDGTFTESRYKTEYSPHLAELFEKNPLLKGKWISPQKESMNVGDTSIVTINREAFLQTKIIDDKHLTLSNYPYLERFLTTNSAQSREEIKKEVQTALQEIAKEKSKQNSQKLLQMSLQKDLIDWIGTPESNQLALLAQIKRRLAGLHEDEFLHDITGLIVALTPKKNLSNKYEAVFTDHFLDLLLCGTQVEGSCQRVDGDANLNKCLLAYLLDGKIRLLAIKDKTGKIVARSIMRLLMQDDKPVLMQERIYPDALDATLQEKLNEFAIKQAMRLNLPLYKSGEASASLVSKGGRAPWEYVDSAQGVTNNVYTINKADVIYTP